eukprot:scaffold171121_cov24-Tisochrysis_lutea.AAC.1
MLHGSQHKASAIEAILRAGATWPSDLIYGSDTGIEMDQTAVTCAARSLLSESGKLTVALACPPLGTLHPKNCSWPGHLGTGHECVRAGQ